MNSTKKNIQKTSGTHKKYKPGQSDLHLKPILKHKG